VARSLTDPRAPLCALNPGCAGAENSSHDGPSGATGFVLAARLDSLIPGASGVFLAEVSRIVERDERPVDGDLYQDVSLISIRASGATRGSLVLIRATGGYDPIMLMEPKPKRPARPEPRFSLKPDAFQAGRRYWFATASDLDPRYPQSVAGCWPADDNEITRLLARAVEQDAYAWHPEIWPSGYVTGWFDALDRSSSSVRVWVGGRLLWGKRLDGLLTRNLVEAWHVYRGKELGGLSPPGLADTANVLMAEVRTRLDSTNAFGLPGRTWRIQHLLDIRSGNVVASRVRVDQTSSIERVYQAYDRDGKLVYERVQDRLGTGGAAVGAEQEAWLRRVERWLEPRTGRVVREEVRRFATIPTFYGSTTDWVLVDRERGLAAGPLRADGP
jgi:hypothetical protein